MHDYRDYIVHEKLHFQFFFQQTQNLSHGNNLGSYGVIYLWLG